MANTNEDVSNICGDERQTSNTLGTFNLQIATKALILDTRQQIPFPPWRNLWMICCLVGLKACTHCLRCSQPERRLQALNEYNGSYCERRRSLLGMRTLPISPSVAISRALPRKQNYRQELGMATGVIHNHVQTILFPGSSAVILQQQVNGKNKSAIVTPYLLCVPRLHMN